HPSGERLEGRQAPRAPGFIPTDPEPRMSTALPVPAPEDDAPRGSLAPRTRRRADEFFDHQPVSRSRLPGPQPLIENLTRCVSEILGGARDLEQIARCVTDDVDGHRLKRVVLSARARQAKGSSPVRPASAIGSTTIFEPRDGVVEAVVIV